MAISADTAYEVKFWMERNNSSYYATKTECLRIFSAPQAGDTTGGTLLGTIAPYYLNAPAEATNGWYQYSFTLPTGTTNQYIVFCFQSDAGGGCKIDDITVRKVPTCADIAGGFATSNVTMTTIDVTINDATATSWEAGYRVSGTNGAYTYVANTAGAMTVSLTGLQSSTYYEIVARRNCGTEYGENTSSLVTNTLCAAATVTAAGFTENFDGLTAGLVGGCYTGKDNPGQYSSQYAVIINSAADARSGSQYFTAAYSMPATSAASFSGSIGICRQTHLEAGKFYEVSVYAKKSTYTYGDFSYDINFVYGSTDDWTLMTTIGTCNVNSTTYEKKVAYFQVTTTGDYYLGFTTSKTGTSSYYVYADDYAVRELTVMPPTNITVTPTSNSAEFHFTFSGNMVELCIDTVEADVLLGRIAHYTDIANPFEIVYGLNPNTRYYYALRSISGNDTSVFTTTASFLTLVAPDTIPFSEDFEGYTAGDWTGAEWARKTSGGSYEFKVLTGSSYNHTATGNQGITLLSGTGTTPYTMSYTQTICRNVLLQTGVNYQISFYTHRFASTSSDNSYDIDFVVGNTMESLDTAWERVRISTDEWVKVSGYFAVPNAGEYYVGMQSSNRGNSYLPIYDDVEIRIANALPPMNINVANLNQNSADINFTANELDNQIVVDTVASEVTLGRIHNAAVASSATPVSLTGLTPNTTYYYAMRGINGNDTSEWTMTGSFTTPCVAVAELPFSEDFEDLPNGQIGGCYTFATSNTGSLNVIANATCNHTPEGSKGLASASNAVSTYSGSSNSTLSFSRDFTLEAGKNYEMALFTKCSYASSTFYLTFYVNQDEIVEKLVDNTAWAQKKAYFTVPADGVYTLRVASRPTGTSYVTTYIDDYTVREVSCITPDLEAIAVKDTEATIAFSTEDGLYEIVYDSLAIDFEDMSAAMFHDTVTTDGLFTITGLEASSEYHVAARLVCDTVNRSDWSDEITFVTSCAPRTVPFTEDFEGYENLAELSECMHPFSASASVSLRAYDSEDYNTTVGGSKGLISYDIYDQMIMPAVASAQMGFSDFVSFEEGKAYEISINAKKMNADYNLVFALGASRDLDNAEELKVDTVNDAEFAQYKVRFVALTTEALYVHLYVQGGATSHKIAMDDYAINEVPCVYATDTMCPDETVYSNYGFNIQREDLDEGLNILEREDNDTMYYVNLYVDFTADTEEEYELKQGETYNWRGMEITEAGRYQQPDFTEYGCLYYHNLTVTMASGVENIAGNVVAIAPNPVKSGEATYVYCNTDEVSAVEVINALGQVVSTFEPTSTPIRVEGIEMSGLYYVRIINNDGSTTVEKLIVK